MPDWYGHIGPSELDLAFDTPSFTQTVSDELGPWGGPDDGMDAELAGIMNDLGTVANDLAALDAILGLGILLGDPTGPSALVQSTPGMEANIVAAGQDLADLNNAALQVGLTPFDGGAPDPGSTNTSPTPQGYDACQGTPNVYNYSVDGFGHSIDVHADVAVNVIVTCTGARLASAADGFFQFYPYVPIQYGKDQNPLVGILQFVATTPGDYYAAVVLTFDSGIPDQLQCFHVHVA